MCRYSFCNYKRTFGCFNCQIGFKRRLMGDAMTTAQVDFTRIDGDAISKDSHCPNCRTLMVDIGRDLRLPKKDQDEQWQCIKYLVDHRYNIYSCGCQGIGFVPHKMEDAIALIKNDKLKHITFYTEQAKALKKQTLAKKRKKNADEVRTKLLLRDVKKEKNDKVLN